MKRKHIVLNIVVGLALALLPPVLLMTAASAAPPSCGDADTAKGQILQGIGQTGNNCDDSHVDNIIATIVNLLSLIAGVVAVIAIIYAGLKYITSGGESGRVSNAKNTLLYALIGLGVAGLAQALVHFVLFQASSA